MRTRDLKHGMRTWCWWKSRYLYFVKKNINPGYYEFKDIDDKYFFLTAKQVKELEVR